MRILYMDANGIGDAVLATPLINSLHQAYTEAEIDWIWINRNKRLIAEMIPFSVGFPSEIDIEYSKAKKRLGRKPSQNERVELLKEYIAEKDSQSNGNRYYDLALFARANSVDFSAAEQQFTRKDLMDFLDQESVGLTCLHFAERPLIFTKLLGIQPIFDSPLEFGEELIVLSDDSVLVPESPYVLFNLGASKEEKKWTPKGFQKVAEWCDKKGYVVYVTGTGEEYDVASRINAPNVINLVPQNPEAVDFKDSKSFSRLASNSTAVIAHDTGFMHLADAIGAKVVALFGPTCPAKWGPYHNRDLVISRYNLDQDVKHIESSEVIRTLESALNRK